MNTEQCSWHAAPAAQGLALLLSSRRCIQRTLPHQLKPSPATSRFGIERVLQGSIAAVCYSKLEYMPRSDAEACRTEGCCPALSPEPKVGSSAEGSSPYSALPLRTSRR